MVDEDGDIITYTVSTSANVQPSSADNIAELEMSNNIIHNTGAFGSANQTNTMAFAIARTRDSLFEDMSAYGYGR